MRKIVPITVPPFVQSAITATNATWSKRAPQRTEARRRAEQHMKHAASQRHEDHATQAAAERLCAWGESLQDVLRQRFGGAVAETCSKSSLMSYPLKVMRVTCALEPLPDPYRTPGGTYEIELAVNLNTVRSIFQARMWFDGFDLMEPAARDQCRPRAMVRLSHPGDFQHRVHPKMTALLDELKGTDRVWETFAASIAELPDALMDL